MCRYPQALFFPFVDNGEYDGIYAEHFTEHGNVTVDEQFRVVCAFIFKELHGEMRRHHIISGFNQRITY